MDFQTLTRRELQCLCKKNRIPANMTNVAMADALRALPSVEGIGEIQDSSDFLSPKKSDLSSSIAPRTTRRTSVRKKIEPVEASTEQTGSPLPRSRRVTARTSEIMRLVYQEEEKDVEEEKQKQEEIVLDRKPPSTAPRSTRRRATKKEEEVGENAIAVEVTNTPATRNGRKMTTRREAAPPVPVEDGQEDREDPSRNTRRTRQSTKSIATAATKTVGTRSSRRGKAAALVSKMDSFDPQDGLQQEQMQQEKDERSEDIQHTVDGSVKESPDLGEAFRSLNLQEKVGGEQVHEEQLSEVEEESQRLSPHNQTDGGLSGREELPESEVIEDVKEDGRLSGQEELPESEVIEDVKEYEIEIQVECQEQVSKAEECQELVEQKQDGVLSKQEELPKSQVAEDVNENEIEAQVNCQEEQVSEAEEECQKLVEQKQEDALHDQEDGGLSEQEEFPESQVGENAKEDEIEIQVECQEEQVSEAEGECQELVEQKQDGDSLHDQEDGSLSGREDEIEIQVECHEGQVSEAEGEGQELVEQKQDGDSLHDQEDGSLSGLEELPESQVAEAVKEAAIEIQVECQEEQISEAEEECQELMEQKQDGDSLLDQEESPIKGLITEDQHKKQDALEESNEDIIHLQGYQLMEAETTSIGTYSENLSLALGNNGSITDFPATFQTEVLTPNNLEEVPVNDEEDCAYSAVESLDKILTAAGNTTSDSAEMSAEFSEFSEKLRIVIGDLENIKISEVEDLTHTSSDAELKDDDVVSSEISTESSSESYKDVITSIVENDSLTVAENANKQSPDFEFLTRDQASGAVPEVLLDAKVVTGEIETDTCKMQDCAALNLESETFAGMDASGAIKQVETGVKQGFSNLSLRKLKKIYKEEVINKVEGKRLPLAKINENLP